MHRKAKCDFSLWAKVPNNNELVEYKKKIVFRRFDNLTRVSDSFFVYSSSFAVWFLVIHRDRLLILLVWEIVSYKKFTFVYRLFSTFYLLAACFHQFRNVRAQTTSRSTRVCSPPKSFTVCFACDRFVVFLKPVRMRRQQQRYGDTTISSNLLRLRSNDRKKTKLVRRSTFALTVSSISCVRVCVQYTQWQRGITISHYNELLTETNDFRLNWYSRLDAKMNVIGTRNIYFKIFHFFAIFNTKRENCHKILNDPFLPRLFQHQFLLIFHKGREVGRECEMR